MNPKFILIDRYDEKDMRNEKMIIRTDLISSMIEVVDPIKYGIPNSVNSLIVYGDKDPQYKPVFCSNTISDLYNQLQLKKYIAVRPNPGGTPYKGIRVDLLFL